MKAIIVAAGRGSRLGALTRYSPKGLLLIIWSPWLRMSFIVFTLQTNLF